MADVAVLGLGYVGLPLAQVMTGAGLRVLGFDVNEEVVAGLNAGTSHVGDLEDADVADMLAAGFHATADESALAGVDTAVVCVPTPLSTGDGPDLTAVIAAAGTVGRQLRPGMLVVLESTTYPGTTAEVVLPLLEETSGLVCGRDFHLAYSPERIDPANQHFHAGNTPKVVGGHTVACGDRAEAVYRKFVPEVVRTRGTREAEMAKLLENTYRHVNIALMNEMARFCHDLGIDLWDAIRAAATKPFGFQTFHPGPGVGGHCIPIDPNYLSHRVRAQLRYPFRFVELAQEINATMPTYVARRAQDLLNTDGAAVNGASILLLGVTYKPNVADDRESPAAPLARQLADWGAKVSYHDPQLSQWTVPGVDVLAVDDPVAAAAEADLTILVQAHRQYDVAALAASARKFFDTRGVATGEAVHRL